MRETFLPAEVVDSMRFWLSDNCDIDSWEWTDTRVISVLRKKYEGGLNRFLRSEG